MKTYRVVQVGVGGFGGCWLRNITDYETTEFSALVDINDENLAGAAEKTGVADDRLFHDLESALAAERPDLAIVVTPPSTRLDVCLPLIEAGIPIISEKPLADTDESCDRLLAAAEAADALYVVSQNYRYRPCIKALRDAALGGELGAPQTAQVNFHKHPHFGGFREEMPYPLIIDMSIHHFDLMRYILDAQPEAVCGMGWNPSWSWFKGEAEATLIFRMSGGVHVSYVSSWCSSRPDAGSWNGHWTIECERGAATMTSDSEVRIIPLEGEERQVELEPMAPQVQAEVLRQTLAAIEGGPAPATCIADNIQSVRMVFRAVEALETGTTISF